MTARIFLWQRERAQFSLWKELKEDAPAQYFARNFDCEKILVTSEGVEIYLRSTRIVNTDKMHRSWCRAARTTGPCNCGANS